MTDNEKTPQLKVFSSTLLEQTDIKAPSFVVDRFMPCGLGALAAQPKTGKSWLGLDLALSVATGQDFWGMPTRQGSVLVLALEDSAYRLKERLNSLGGTFPPNLNFVLRDTLTLRNGLVNQLSQWTESAPEPALIIIDTLGRVRGFGSGRNVDAYNLDTGLYSGLQELAIKKGISILGVTHQRKQGSIILDDQFERITGSNGLFALCDFVWLIAGKRTDHEKTLHVTGRDIEQGAFKITFNGTRWTMLGNADDLEKTQRVDGYLQSPLRRTILELIHASGTWSGSATTLMELTNQSQGTSFDNARAFGFALSKINDLLLEIDQIKFERAAGGYFGRDYTFKHVKKPCSSC